MMRDSFGSASLESPVRTVAKPSSGVRFRDWALWLALGVLAGGAPVFADALGVPTRYVAYGVVATVFAGAIGYVVSFVGSVESLLWIAFVFSLQFELTFTPVSVEGGKAAGPYGIMISLTLLSGLALLAIWESARMWGDGERLRVDRDVLLASSGLLCAALLSFMNAVGRMLSVFGVFELLALTVTAVVANHGCSKPQNVSRLRSALFVALFIQSALIVVEQVLGVQISLSQGFNTSYGWGSGEEGRFAGTFGAPSCAATFLVVCLVFLFRRLTSKTPPSRATALWGLFAFGFLALLLTRTRSEWIGFVIACAGMGWHCYREGTLSRRVANRLVIGGLAALLIAWPLVVQRLDEDHKGAADTRENLVWIAAAMIKAHPFAGVGINTATNQVYSYALGAGLADSWVFIVHNQFLLVAAETGIPGLAAFLALVWVGLRSARRCMRSDDCLVKETGGALFWSLIAMCWALNLDHVSGTMTYVLFWFLIGAACGLDALRRRESELMAAGPGAGATAVVAA
jgi:O-antigen ligase